jgi:hypothetical protein
MTPYELRFEIFKQATNLAQDEYNASYEIVREHNDNSETKWNYPPFPSYEKIEKLAEKINTFVSSK